jgi:hypothetical protein
MANKRISQLPFVGNTGYTSIDIMPIVNYDIPTGTTKYTPIIDFKNWALSAISVTYSELSTLISSNDLVQGSYYLITDFQTIYDLPDYFPDGTPRTNIETLITAVDPIIVFATSNNTISINAYQPSYPNDTIKYDYDWTTTEINGSSAKGRITERIDEYNNRTDYDHRKVQFKRYTSYSSNSKLTGTISDYDCTTGIVVGVDTLFFGEINPGDIILFNSKSILGYYIGVKVLNILSNTTMEVLIDLTYSGTIFTGADIDYYSSFIAGFNLDYKEVYVGQSDESDFASTYTFQLNGYTLDNYIGDHSSYYINGSSPFGLSFLLSNNVIGYTSLSNNFGDISFNNSFNDKTQKNKISGLFYNNVMRDIFADNKIGSYFNENIFLNQMLNNQIGDNFSNNIQINKSFNDNQIQNNFTYNVFYDGFESNVIGNYFNDNIFFTYVIQNNIGNYFNNNTVLPSFSYNVIGENFANNQIINTKAEFVDNHIGNNFLNNVIGNNFSSNQIGNYFGDTVKKSNQIGTEFKNNQIGDYFGSDGVQNPLGNQIGVVTTIGFDTLQSVPSGITLTNGGTSYSDSTNVSTTGGLGSSLTVDILTDGTGVITGVTINTPGTYYSVGDSITIVGGGNDATFDITGVTSFTVGDTIDNGIGDSCEVVSIESLSSITVNVLIGELGIGNTINNNTDSSAIISSIDITVYSDGSMKDNVIGNHFINNQIGLEFNNNQIGNYFGNDMSTDISNIILDNFKSNIISNYFGIDVETPSTGEGGNIIRNNFIGNTIGDSFTYNITYDTSDGGYNNNQIGWGCNTNTFGDGFNYNKIGDLFQENLLGVYFAGNEIGYFFNLNQINDNASFNRIGEISWFNQIDTGFEANRTGVSFFGNTIGIDFVHNTIGNYFGQFFLAGNTWGDNVYDNKFGDHTYGNDVSSNFNNNNIFNNFIGNIVGDNFQYNVIQYDVSDDFTSATHVYSPYTCTLLNDQTSTLKLIYLDGTPALVAVSPTS